jgi:ABC-type multidrug transport system permease subunit
VGNHQTLIYQMGSTVDGHAAVVVHRSSLPSSRAGFSYLMMGIVYLIILMYYSTFAQWVAAMAPSAAIAAQLFGSFGFVITL